MTHKELNIDGWQCIAFDTGIYTFQKLINKRWYGIECTKEQLENGDFEYMTKHGYTLSKERIRLEKARYLRAAAKERGCALHKAYQAQYGLSDKWKTGGQKCCQIKFCPYAETTYITFFKNRLLPNFIL